MLIKMLLVAGAAGLTVGTALQIASWAYQDRRMRIEARPKQRSGGKQPGRVVEQALTTWAVFTWFFDWSAFTSDKPAEKHKSLLDRSFRRQRTGWNYLFLGAVLTLIGTVLDLINLVQAN
jgi:hypothetical protein